MNTNTTQNSLESVDTATRSTDYTAPIPRAVALASVGLATAFALLVSTLLVLLVVSAGPAGIAGVPVVMAGTFTIVAAPTIVWQVGLELVDDGRPSHG